MEEAAGPPRLCASICGLHERGVSIGAVSDALTRRLGGRTRWIPNSHVHFSLWLRRAAL